MMYVTYIGDSMRAIAVTLGMLVVLVVLLVATYHATFPAHFLKVGRISVKEALDAADTGDILLFINSGYYLEYPRFSPFSHSALIIKNGGSPYAHEVYSPRVRKMYPAFKEELTTQTTLDRDLVVTGLEERIRLNREAIGGRIYLVKRRVPLTVKERKAVYTAAYGKRVTAMTRLEVVLATLGINGLIEKEDRHCYSYTYSILSDAGILPKRWPLYAQPYKFSQLALYGQNGYFPLMEIR